MEISTVEQLAIDLAVTYKSYGWNIPSIERQLHWELGDFTDNTDPLVEMAINHINSPLFLAMSEDEEVTD